MTPNPAVSSFAGDWALVTGASAGIGREFASRLAAGGMHVVLVARRRDRLDALADELRRRHGVRTLVIALDLSAPDAVASIAAALTLHGIRVRLLCNNAAFGHWGDIDAHDATFYTRMVQVNLTTPIALCRELLAGLRSFPTSAVINVSSGAAFQPVPYMAVYAATKAALSSFSLALHTELAPLGVAVQTFVPAPTESEFDGLAGAPPIAARGRLTAEAAVRHALAHLAMGKPLVTHAKGTATQRFFNGVFPMRMVLREVGKRFKPTKKIG